ncbi:thaumatin-like protein [Neltuma alba]|uniref:thaumatin-like protein n=1 Tax=Neltuma alba TaxID=207710 RepID=UPI0010A33FB5|nr:thaumatin-like protein [Prosopis alba]
MALIVKSHLLVLLFLPALINFTFTQAAQFEVTNSCPYTVWAAGSAFPLGGGQPLDPGRSTVLSVATSGPLRARIWGQTKCIFYWWGRGHCETGDCGGQLSCEPSATVAEFFLNWKNNDYYAISVISGFNVPMKLTPTFECRGLRCDDNKCPDAYLYPQDNTKSHTCPSGTNYRVVFCPQD